MTRLIATCAVVLGIVCVAWAFARGPLRDPSAALKEFESATDRAEDMIADPLILTGCGAAPLVTREIANPSMPLRRYAIGYLGNRKCLHALPALRVIVESEGERDYFRADAMEAIYQINPDEGRRLARASESGSAYLAERSNAILSSAELIGLDRTYFQAVRGWHD